MDSALIVFPSLSLPGLSSTVPVSQSRSSCAVNGKRFLVSQGLEDFGGSWDR